MPPALSKTKSSFYRRLYVAHLIERGIASVPALIEATGMPRRTAQDTIASLSELDILCEFERDDGERHNIGRYRIRDWGAIDPRWVANHSMHLKRALGYP
ncbi:winged helix-turn-helix domain-containing protein [Franzmannia qiaohouensis]|uniref:Winged helix-turn-helix domain-containing protein n=1 Tax=Franzmannia qiaohouensis TaxID=1329370 RepID=A0ABU1H9K7_9GAMM|nr:MULTISPECIES: winged helix-turn-helix domain-containing protein [Halomonas]MDR5904145.1 winged helix-turn-helix domain-containing protein [Halomonas qiaohouensis]